jgi:hypothetical protein
MSELFDDDLRRKEARKILELAEEHEPHPWMARFRVCGPTIEQVSIENWYCLGVEQPLVSGWTVVDVLEHRIAIAPVAKFQPVYTGIISEEVAVKIACFLWTSWLESGEPARILAEVPHSPE